MRVAGVRISPPYARLLVDILDDHGFDAPARALEDAIRLQVLEPPLTLEDHEAILLALGDECPPGLARLRRELLDQQMRRRLYGR